MKTLADLARGERGRIDQVQGEDAVAVRLLEMGLTEGEEVSLLGQAPLGDPLEFLVRGYRLSLRRAEAGRVLISPPLEGTVPPPDASREST